MVDVHHVNLIGVVNYLCRNYNLPNLTCYPFYLPLAFASAPSYNPGLDD
jgi:hypothetical protein